MDKINALGIRKFLVFKLESEEYAIDIQKITTIIEKDMSIARVPKTPDYLKGVINLRGEIIPVINLRKRFKLQEEDTKENRIIIVKLEDIAVGIIVDSVAEVVELDDNSIENITNIGGPMSFDYIMGVGKIDGRIITLLHLEKLISLSKETAKL